jgi:regulator of replication initiation timing
MTHFSSAPPTQGEELFMQRAEINELRAEFKRVRAENERLHERLEDNQLWEIDTAGNKKRVEVEPGVDPRWHNLPGFDDKA